MNRKQKIAIKQFIRAIDGTIKVKFQKGGLECDPVKGIVYIGDEVTEEENDLFEDFVKELEPKCTFNSYLMGLLHEIGHIFTYDEELDEDRDEQYAIMQIAYKFDLVDAASLNKMYFKIPMELEATKWGIEFAMNNKNFVEKFNEVIK